MMQEPQKGRSGSGGARWAFWGVAALVVLALGLIVVDSVDDTAMDEANTAVPIESLENAEAEPVPAEDSSIGKSSGPYRSP